MLMLMLAMTVATAEPPKAMPVTADERNSLREACAALKQAEPDAIKSKAAFKKCVDQIPYDGDLPAKKAVKR